MAGLPASRRLRGLRRVVPLGGVHAACLVHSRRRFAKIVKDAPKGSPPGLAHEALKYFAEVYRIEVEIRDADPDERWRVRQMQTKPLMVEFHRWLSGHAPTVLPKSPLGEAFGYALSNWVALNTFVEHGILEADNNRGRTGSSRAPSAAGAPRPSPSASSRRRGSTAWSPTRTCATCSSASTVIARIDWRSCCR